MVQDELFPHDGDLRFLLKNFVDPSEKCGEGMVDGEVERVEVVVAVLVLVEGRGY